MAYVVLWAVCVAAPLQWHLTDAVGIVALQEFEKELKDAVADDEEPPKALGSKDEPASKP